MLCTLRRFPLHTMVLWFGYGCRFAMWIYYQFLYRSLLVEDSLLFVVCCALSPNKKLCLRFSCNDTNRLLKYQQKWFTSRIVTQLVSLMSCHVMRIWSTQHQIQSYEIRSTVFDSAYIFLVNNIAHVYGLSLFLSTSSSPFLSFFLSRTLFHSVCLHVLCMCVSLWVFYS